MTSQYQDQSSASAQTLKKRNGSVLRANSHYEKSALFDDLNDVLVVKDVFFAHALRIVLDGRAPHQSTVQNKSPVRKALTT